MYYNHQLRTNLQERKNRFLKSDFDDALNEFMHLFEYIFKEAAIITILDDLVIQNPYLFVSVEAIIDFGLDRHRFATRKDHVSFIYHYCKWIIDEKKDFRYYMIDGSSARENCDSFKERFVSPLIDYLHDHLDSISQTLYILQKYKHRTEWFTRKELRAKYKNANKLFEDLLEDDLRLFLFDQGIDYPFSTPKSASGRADIVSLIDTEDPLVLEIKIFDSEKGYRKERIVSGFTQIVKYANDYHKDTGYLIVFNMDNLEIEVMGHETDNKWPNRYIFNGKTFYIIFINMYNEVTASKVGQLKKESILFEELTKSV